MFEYSSVSQSSFRNDSQMELKEIYNTIRGKAEEFGIEGYRISKKPDLLVTREYSIGKSPKKDIASDFSKRAKEPSSVTYSPTHEKINKEYWTPRNGKFEKARRKSYIDEILKFHGPLPGPSHYHKDSQSLSPKKKVKDAFIGKSENPGYMGNIVSLAEESPASNAYFTDEVSRNKAYSLREKKSSVFKYYKPFHEAKPKDKDIVGPGYLSNLEKSYFKESSKPKAPIAVFPKSNAPRVIHHRTSSDTFVPGVGAYKDIDLAYTNNIVKQKSKTAIISKSIFKRHTEEIANTKSWVPGPGSYDLTPQLRKNK